VDHTTGCNGFVLQGDCLDLTGGWKRLHNEEINSWYSFPNIISMIKLSMMRWAGYVTRVGKMRNVDKIWSQNLNERNHLGDLGVQEDNIKMNLREIGWVACI
jgi:hypothetical protein